MNARTTRTARTAALTIAALTLVGVPAAHAVQGSTPSAVAANATVKLDVAGVRACSGALINASWVVTAASCLETTPGAGVTQGAPAQATTATIARADLTSSSGHVVPVDAVVPHPDRDLALVRLATPVLGITPVSVTATAPAVGDTLTVTGYGRTSTELVPATAHAATFTVAAVAADTLGIQAESAGATICKGDAGGPALRTTAGGGVELVAIHSTAYQGGCLGQTTTLQGATETRVDDLGGWFATHARTSCAPTPAAAPANPPVGNGQLIRTPDGTVSIVAGGAKFALSYAQWLAMGLPRYTDVSPATAATLVDVPRDNTFLRNPADGSIYQIVSGARYGLTMTEWKALGAPAYVDVPVEFIARAAETAPGGPALLRDTATSTIHQVVGCSRYQLSQAEWQALGSPAYVNVPGRFIARIPTGVPTRYALLRDRTDGGLYQVVGGAKYRLSVAEWQALKSPAYTEVAPALLARVTGTVPSGRALLRDVVSGAIYQVERGTKRKLSLEQWLALPDRTYVDVPGAWLGLIPNA